MRKIVPVLFGVGGFLLVAGLVALLWAPGVVKKTPLDVTTTTRLSGQAAKIDPSTGDLNPQKVKATSITKTDSKVSDDNVVAWTNTSCLVVDVDNPPDCVDAKDDRLVSASTDVFATDRVTALAVNKSKYLPADAVKHEGLVNKWPFDSEKKTYPYWDGTLGEPVDAKYQRTVKVKGLETYLYKSTTEGAKIDVAEDTPGTYDDIKTFYVEPKTGAIINQTDDQQRTLENGTKVLDLQLAFTDKQIQTSVNDANDNIASLNLITRTIPLVGIIGGAVCLIAGLVLLLMGRREPPKHGANTPASGGSAPAASGETQNV